MDTTEINGELNGDLRDIPEPSGGFSTSPPGFSDDGGEFITVTHRKAFRKPSATGINAKTSSKPRFSRNSSRRTSSSLPCKIPDSTSPEEFATDIHAIDASIQRVRLRINQDCGSGFLPNLIEACVYKFEKLLGISGPYEIVCYALGRFSVPSDWGFSCRLQLILLQDLVAHFRVPVFIFDPAFSPLEMQYLSSEYCGFSVIPANEEAKRLALKPTLFFMIHADGFLYENVIEANHKSGTLQNVILLGNTLDSEKKGFSCRKSIFFNCCDDEHHERVECLHIEKNLPLKDRSGLFSVALTPDSVLHFFLPKKDAD